MVKRRGASKKIAQQSSQYGLWVGRVGRLAMVVLTIAMLGWVSNWVRHPENLPLTSIRVQGEIKHLAQGEIQQVIAPFVKQGFIGVELQELSEALQGLSWVDKVTIRRRWPASLEVTIAEQQPLARWGGQGMLNIHGEFFAVAQADEFSTLPQLSGPEGSESQMANYYTTVGKMLQPIGLEIKSLVMDERRSMAITLINGPQLILGRSDGYERLLRFVRIYPRTFTSRMGVVKQLDLRYTNGLAVQWREGFAPEVV